MPCPSFEDLLLDYTELSPAQRQTVDAHVAGCTACREYVAILVRLDARLTALYAGAGASPAFTRRVRDRVHRQAARPSWIPELLDFLGWAAVLVLAVCVAPLLFPLLPPLDSSPWPIILTLAAGAAIAVSAAVWLGLRSFFDLEH